MRVGLHGACPAQTVSPSESEEVRLASAVAVEAVPISLGVVTAFSA